MSLWTREILGWIEVIDPSVLMTGKTQRAGRQSLVTQSGTGFSLHPLFNGRASVREKECCILNKFGFGEYPLAISFIFWFVLAYKDGVIPTLRCRMMTYYSVFLWRSGFVRPIID